MTRVFHNETSLELEIYSDGPDVPSVIETINSEKAGIEYDFVAPLMIRVMFSRKVS